LPCWTRAPEKLTITTMTEVRMATVDDLNALVRFNQAIASETEGKQLDEATLREGVKTLFARPEYGFYIVAQQEKTIAGALMITFEWSDWRNGCFWWVQSVYVQAEFRRQGIYRALYGHVRQMAREQGGVCGFRLYVEKENEAAQRTYTSMGMGETEYLMFSSGD
jgi:ribosomal protein S18 acetylase RimI-like enzyme